MTSTALSHHVYKVVRESSSPNTLTSFEVRDASQAKLYVPNARHLASSPVFFFTSRRLALLYMESWHKRRPSMLVGAQLWSACVAHIYSTASMLPKTSRPDLFIPYWTAYYGVSSDFCIDIEDMSVTPRGSLLGFEFRLIRRLSLPPELERAVFAEEAI